MLIEGMLQSPNWETAKKRLCQVFSPGATKMHAATRILSRPQATNKTLQEYTQRFTDLVIKAMGTDPTVGTCLGTTVLHIRHFLS